MSSKIITKIIATPREKKSQHSHTHSTTQTHNHKDYHYTSFQRHLDSHSYTGTKPLIVNSLKQHRHSQSHHIQIYSHSGTIIHVDAQNHIAHRITPSHTHTLKRCYFCFLGQTSRQVGMRSSSFHSPPPPHTHSIPSEETSRFGLLCFRVYFSRASVSQFNSRIP